MAVNKDHPDYPEYKDKFWDIFRREEEEMSKIISNPKRLDGPSGAIHRKYVNEMKELQKEYAHLFYEE